MDEEDKEVLIKLSPWALALGVAAGIWFFLISFIGIDILQGLLKGMMLQRGGG